MLLYYGSAIRRNRAFKVGLDSRWWSATIAGYDYTTYYSDTRMGRRLKRVCILLFFWYIYIRSPAGFDGGRFARQLDESAFSHPLPTVFWRDKRFFNYLYTSFNDQPAAAHAATPRLSYVLHIIIINVYRYTYYIYIYNIVLFSRPPPRLPITITGRLFAVIIKKKKNYVRCKIIAMRWWACGRRQKNYLYIFEEMRRRKLTHLNILSFMWCICIL